MIKSCVIRSATGAAWGMALTNPLIAWLVPQLEGRVGLWWLLGLFGWLLISVLWSAVLLPVCCCRQIDRWRYWGVLLGLCLLSAGLFPRAIVWSSSPAFVVRTLFVWSWLVALISLVLLLIKRDIGVRLYASSELLWVWLGVLVLGPPENVVETALQTALRIQAGGPVGPLWWFGLVSLAAYVVSWLAPLGIAGHLLWLVVREVQQPPLLVAAGDGPGDGASSAKDGG